MPFISLAQSSHYDPIGSLDPLHSSDHSQNINAEMVPLIYPSMNPADELNGTTTSVDNDDSQYNIELEYSKTYDASELVIDSFQQPITFGDETTASGSSEPPAHTFQPVQADTLTTLPHGADPVD